MNFIQITKHFSLRFLILGCITYLLASCSSKDVTPSVTDNQVTIASTMIKDNYELDATLNLIFKDVYSVLNNDLATVLYITTISGTTLTTTFGTNLIAYTISQDKKTYNITFTGVSDNNGITKSGKIVASVNIGSSFTATGVDFTLKFDNLNFSHDVYNYSLLSGSYLFKNQNGGMPVTKTLLDTNVQFKISGYSNIQLASNYTYGYTIGRVSNWVLTNGEIIETIAASSVADGFTDLVSYGKNPSGLKFYTKLNQPIVFNYSKCGNFKAVSGEYNSVIINTSDGTTYLNFKPNIISGCFSNYSVTTLNAKGSSKASTVSLLNW